MSKNSKEIERMEFLRDAQTEAMQSLLFTMRELGQPSAFIQLEFEGVCYFLAARQVTQAEFDTIVEQVVMQKR